MPRSIMRQQSKKVVNFKQYFEQLEFKLKNIKLSKKIDREQFKEQYKFLSKSD